ncbi:MAG: carboxymuconolactone decarboxylase family protein [Acidimicrobiales bacterium]
MPRVDLFDAHSAPISAREFFAVGDPGPIVAALAAVPELLGPTLGFIGAALGHGAVSVRHKEIAILRTSALQQCRYCVHAHSLVALDVGLSVEEIRGIRGELSLDVAFADLAERRLLRWIDAMAGMTGPVPDDVWVDVKESFADHLLIELSATIGATMFLNRFATGFELASAPDTLRRLANEGLC